MRKSVERRVPGSGDNAVQIDGAVDRICRYGLPLQIASPVMGGHRLRGVGVHLRWARQVELLRVWPDDPPAGFEEAVQLALAQRRGSSERSVGLLVLAPLGQKP